MTSQPFWEQAYQDLEGSTFGKPSKEFYELVQTLRPGSRVLDLGCGEGRNALFLAENELDVTAVDSSEQGIRKLNHLAGERRLR